MTAVGTSVIHGPNIDLVENGVYRARLGIHVVKLFATEDTVRSALEDQGWADVGFYDPAQLPADWPPGERAEDPNSAWTAFLQGRFTRTTRAVPISDFPSTVTLLGMWALWEPPMVTPAQPTGAFFEIGSDGHLRLRTDTAFYSQDYVPALATQAWTVPAPSDEWVRIGNFEPIEGEAGTGQAGSAWIGTKKAEGKVVVLDRAATESTWGIFLVAMTPDRADYFTNGASATAAAIEPASVYPPPPGPPPPTPGTSTQKKVSIGAVAFLAVVAVAAVGYVVMDRWLGKRERAHA